MTTTPAPTDTRTPTRALWGAGVAAAVLIGVLTSVAAIVALGVAASSGATSVGVPGAVMLGVLLRTAVSLIVVAVVIGGAAMLTRSGSLRWWSGVAVVGYLLNLFVWGGNALFVSAVLSQGGDPSLVSRVVGFVVDLVLWLAVAAYAARLGLARGRARVERHHGLG